MTTRAPRNAARTGVLAGLGAYGLWGAFPLYFPLLAPAEPVAVIAHRVVWSLLVMVVVVTATRGWRQVLEVARDRRTLVTLAVAAVLLSVNWLVYVFAVMTGHVVDAALGYFINPLITVALAVTLLRERVSRTQLVALALGAAAVVVIALGYGRFPWVAVVLALTFGGYGLLKNRAGRTVGAATGLTIETAVLAPVAAGYLVWLTAAGSSTFTTIGGWHAAALASAGLVTVVPLLLFAAAARRTSLTLIGLMQYGTPVVQFLIGVLVFGEHMPASRWWGFALVWVALVVLTVDGLRRGRAHRLARAADAPA